MNWPHCMSHSVYLFVAHRSGKQYKTTESTTTRLRNSVFPRAVKAVSPPTATPAQITPPPDILHLLWDCDSFAHFPSTHIVCFFLFFFLF